LCNYELIADEVRIGSTELAISYTR
jgi:hypothetical protein